MVLSRRGIRRRNTKINAKNRRSAATATSAAAAEAAAVVVLLPISATPFEPAAVLPPAEIRLFETSSKSEALFLMGIGGRNVSLIRKHTNVAIYIRDGSTVSMHAKWPNSDPQRAWCMVLSACCGGILRWFTTPAATDKWYSQRSATEQAGIAASHGCTLELLRSRIGHMCLMLVPHSALLFDGSEKPDDAAVAAVRAMLPIARQQLLLMPRI